MCNESCYSVGMNDVQQKLGELRNKGWTDASIGDSIGTTRVTVSRWRNGVHYPDHAELVMMGLDNLLKRKRIPKQRRYAPGSRRRTNTDSR